MRAGTFKADAISMIVGSICTLLSSCSPASASMQTPVPLPDELSGSQWKIYSYSGGPQTRPPGSPDLALNISFKNGDIEGNPGCGRLSGRYSLSGNYIDIAAKWSAGAVSCSESLEKQAEALLKALSGRRELRPTGFTPANTTFLSLYDVDGNLQVFLAAYKPGGDLQKFDGTFWRLADSSGARAANLAGGEMWITKGRIEVSRFGCYKLYTFRYGLKGISFFSTDNRGGHRCDPDAHQAFFTAFTNALTETSHYTVQGDSLIFAGASNNETMKLERIRSSGIEYHTWHITSYFNGKSLVSPSDELDPHITLLQGRIQGSPGCGDLSGGYELHDDTLTIKIHASFLAGGWCPSGAWETTNPIIIKALHSEFKVKIEGNAATLVDKENIIRFTLERR